MHDINLSKYKNLPSLLLLILLSKNNITLANEVSETNLLLDDETIKSTLEVYGIPTIYTAFEIIKLKPHVINYIKGIYSSIKISEKKL